MRRALFLSLSISTSDMVHVDIRTAGFGVIVGALITLALLECALRQLPVNTGMRLRPVDEENPVQRGVPYSKFTYSQGWDFANARTATLNNYGFYDNIDYTAQSRPVVVIGDSFVEGQMIAAGKSIAAQLRKQDNLLQLTYALGTSGAGLSDYVAFARFAVREFRPRALVVLIVDGDIKESLEPKKGGYYFRWKEGTAQLTRIDSGTGGYLWNVLTKSKLFLYLVQNLKFRPRKIVDSVSWHLKRGPEIDVASLSRAVEAFLSALPNASQLPPQRIALVFDPNRATLFDGSAKRESKNPEDAARTQLMRSAASRGYVVIDLYETFRQDFASTRVRPDFAPFDMHWNSRGHWLAAREVGARLLPVLQGRPTENTDKMLSTAGIAQ